MSDNKEAQRLVELNAEALALERQREARAVEAMALEKRRVQEAADYYARAEAHAEFVRQHTERQTLALERLANAVEDKRLSDDDDDITVGLFRDNGLWGWEVRTKEGAAACGYEASPAAALRAAAKWVQK